MKMGICLVSPSPGRSLTSKSSGAISWQGRSNLSLQPIISTSSSTSFHTRSVFGPILPMKDSVFTSLNLVPINRPPWKFSVYLLRGGSSNVPQVRAPWRAKAVLGYSGICSSRHRRKGSRRRQNSNRRWPKRSPRQPGLQVYLVGPREYAAGALAASSAVPEKLSIGSADQRVHVDADNIPAPGRWPGVIDSMLE